MNGENSMKMLRTCGFFILVVIVVLLLLYILGWRRQVPTAFLVNGNGVTPTLRTGQVLEWHGSKPFVVEFLNGGSPCKDISIKSVQDANGIQVASCKVINLPAGTQFTYHIVNRAANPGIRGGGGGVIPCPGCSFLSEAGSGPDTEARHLTPTTGLPPTPTDGFGSANIACDNDANAVQITYPTTHPNDDTTYVNFYPAPDVQSFKPNFTSPDVSCSNFSGPDWQCTFTPATTPASYPYTVTVTPTSGTACGVASGSTTATGNGTVAVP
jgi:hypothetical protein